MKSLIAGGVFAVLVAVPAAAQDNETSMRCSVPTDVSIYARDAGAISRVTRGQAVVTRTGSPPPAVMVDGWRPAPGPLPVVLSQLGSEAGFAVTGADGLGTVTWNGGSAPLASVLDNLTAQVGASWSFSSGVVRIARTPPVSTVNATLPAPSNRDVSLALLDTLRGYEAMDVRMGGGTISFQASPQAMTKIETGIAGINEVYAFDVTFYRGRPNAGRYAWSSLGSSVVADGAGGRILLDEQGDRRLASFLSAAGDVEAGKQQTVAGPAGWAVVVPQSQCGTGNLELTLRPKRAGDGFSMNVAGLGAPVDVPMVTLGQTLVVAAREPVAGWISMVTIRPRIVSVR